MYILMFFPLEYIHHIRTSNNPSILFLLGKEWIAGIKQHIDTTTYSFLIIKSKYGFKILYLYKYFITCTIIEFSFEYSGILVLQRPWL
jgi:hypothetical protein